MRLTKTELKDLTGRNYSREQIEALAFMDIKFRVLPDGTHAVLRADLSPADLNSPPSGKE